MTWVELSWAIGYVVSKFEVSLSVFERGRRRPEYTLDSDLNGEMTLMDLLEWTKSTLIITADEVLKEEQSRGFDKKPVLIVDNTKGKSPLDVSPLGQIEFIARQQFGPVLIEAYEGLIHRSKVLTGAYIKSHYVFHNGKQVATDLESLKTWLTVNPPDFKEKDTIRIVNIQPYARRLEMLGVTAQRSKQSSNKIRGQGNFVRVPNGVYQLTTRAIRSKYKYNSIIKFTFLPGGSMGLSASFKKGRRGKNSAGRPYLYPSIVFTITERGLL